MPSALKSAMLALLMLALLDAQDKNNGAKRVLICHVIALCAAR